MLISVPIKVLSFCSYVNYTRSARSHVFEDMRSCRAGIIHVGAEGKYLDRDGNEHTKINDNVLIEIGASMALYGKKVILLVEGGVTLPSNLQGLYRCEFNGDRLAYEPPV